MTSFRLYTNRTLDHIIAAAENACYQLHQFDVGYSEVPDWSPNMCAAYGDMLAYDALEDDLRELLDDDFYVTHPDRKKPCGCTFTGSGLILRFCPTDAARFDRGEL